VKLLHTADWHVGKTIKGASRLAEHAAVLGDVVRIASDERVDVVVVAGDLYETVAPPPDAEALVLRTLLDLRDTGAQVVVVSGNHDHAQRFEAVRPVLGALGITVAGVPRRRDDGGLVALETPGGDGARVALVPFCSQRSIIRSAQLMALDAAQLAQTYDERIRRMIAHLTDDLPDDAVNVVVAHGMVGGAQLGGGERSAQTYMDYWIGSAAFPTSLHYVALGHVHRTQPVGGATQIWYSGSPLAVDFGDADPTANVLLVEATPSTPAQVRPASVHGGRRLRTLRGSLEELRAAAGTTADDFLRVIVEDPGRAGLAETVRELLGDTVVEVQLDRSGADHGIRTEPRAGRGTRTPHDLFAEYLAREQIDDDRIGRLFAELLDEETA
jgi:DNA repair protein SbcD/Mre11